MLITITIVFSKLTCLGLRCSRLTPLVGGDVSNDFGWNVSYFVSKVKRNYWSNVLDLYWLRCIKYFKRKEGKSLKNNYIFNLYVPHYLIGYIFSYMVYSHGHGIVMVIESV